MKLIVIKWCGPYNMTEETPIYMYGKKGVFAITHKSETIYIGKAEEGSSTVFKESKRTNKMVKCLINKGFLPRDTPLQVGQEHVEKHCKRYVGPIEEINKITLAERCLIFKQQPICNVEYRENYKKEPVKIINKGSMPEDLLKQIKCNPKK